MTDMSVEFIGGEKDGQSLSPISANELETLGYRCASKTTPRGDELIVCIAVPIKWAATQAHQAIQERVNLGYQKKTRKKIALNTIAISKRNKAKVK